jgi:hypothetical protein
MSTSSRPRRQHTPFAALEKQAGNIQNAVDWAVSNPAKRMAQRADAGFRSATTAAQQAGQANVNAGSWGALKGAGKTLWNAATAPIHSLGAGIGGAFSRANEGLGGFVEGGIMGARNAAVTDMKDAGAGLGQVAGGAGQFAYGAGQKAFAPIAGIGGAFKGVFGGSPSSAATPPASPTPAPRAVSFASAPKPAPAPAAPFGQQFFAKSAFAKLAFQAPQPMLANAGAAGVYSPRPMAVGINNGDTTGKLVGYPAKRTGMGDINSWIAQAGPQLPDRPGTHQRALSSPAPKSALPPTLGADTPSGQGMTMTGPGAGFGAGVPVIDQGASPTPSPVKDADLSKEFRKYHGTRFNPNSSMDKEKMKQLQEVYRQTGGKLSAQSVYQRQYGPGWGTKSASAFGVLGEMEKASGVPSGLSGLLSKGLSWGSSALRRSSRTAKNQAAEAASKAVTPVDPATFGGFRGLSAGRAARAAEDATVAARDSAHAAAFARTGNARRGAAQGLAKATRTLHDNEGLQRAINYGIPTVAGGGLLYGSNRMGHSSGLATGRSEGYDAGTEAALAAMPNSAGYIGNLMNAVMGQQPMDAAAMRGMLDEQKSNILQTILSGRAAS